jgi:chromate reductase, NAD(P)H dehydrogenase (quinone)
MNILSFGASYSKHSINKAFATYVAQQFEGHEIEILDLNDFPLPVFTVDSELEIGHPQVINNFLAKLDWTDLIIISIAEHNGAYTAAFKNLFDWTSRVKAKLFEGKKILLLATSDGGRGAQGALALAVDRFPRHGAKILATFSLPKFRENFNPENGVLDQNLNAELQEIIEKIKKLID